ncbi:MAG: TetR/AcrR family transcriptional regulator, partial [Hyphomonadaceae bacterium]
MTRSSEDVAAKTVSRGEARRAAFLEAATDVFLEQGYEAASVNEVVRRAGGSLATLYSQFGNKDGLFAAVVEQATTRFSQSIMSAVDPDMALADGLQAIGEHFLTTALTPRSLAFFRLIVGEGRK